MKIGFYYSHWQDWEGTGGDISTDHLEGEEYVHPTDSEFENYWQNKCLVQVRELIENYDPWFLWFDTWSLESFELITPQRQDELIALIRSLSKKCLVNSRIQFRAPSDQVDFMSTMDNSFPTKGFRKPWETSGTFNDSWGCHAMDYRWRPTKELIENLVKNASLGGNYQLNVGPMGNGCFQEAAIKHLREVGAWLRANGEAIYGTLGSTFDKMPWGHITRRPLDAKRTRLYLHLWKFTPGTAILLPGVSLHVIKAESIATGQPIEAELGEKGIWIRLPQELDPDDLPVIKLDVFEDSAGIPESRADHERELGQ